MVLIVLGAVLGVCCLGGILLVVLVPQADDAPAGALGTPTAGSRTTTAPPPAVVTTPPPATRPAPTTTPPAARPDYAAAAAAVRATNKHFRDQLAAGQDAFNKPAFAPWFQATTQDLACENTRVSAGKAIGLGNDTPLQTWYSDCVDLSSHVIQWANAALLAEPGPATPKMADLLKTISSDLDRVDRDATAIAKG